MKKILLLALLVPAIGFSQESEEIKTERTISVHGAADFVGKVGISYEAAVNSRGNSNKRSFYIDASFGATSIDFVGIPSIDGNGIVVGIGYRTYWNKEQYKGFYGQGGIESGDIKFDENTPIGKFEGKYRYISFFNPSIGYKAKLGNFSIDPSIGFQWNIEVKGKGDFDNRYIDNTSLKLGLKIGYTF